jgi:hypothetical protein
MQEKRGSAVFAALPPIAAGHVLAMSAVLLPFALVTVSLDQVRALGLLAGVMLIAFGGYKLVNRRHPRFLVRVGPDRLVWWSFLMATAHGAGLMLLPVYLGLGMTAHGSGSGHAAMAQIASAGVMSASIVAVVHTGAMLLIGGLIAWLVYRYLGLRLLQRAWFNLDLLWAACLIVVGGIAVAAAV